ncbi:olfactory receptor 11A1-like [Periophthalmus magnuspinnatus]|uniref:olfactory receptor 11A1-like n=1 Tax=Periophthalmus magnuspinnatus TaxID=409849 RepID=UPI00145BB380|nr:olfactory receptor 11A1-like [Periophthalmus magnuspinnatus]
MVNSSQVSHFTLGAYYDTGPLKWLYFVIILSVYILIVLSNLLLIIVICLNRTLHEPMYIFLCSLFMNELFGSTALFPMLLWEIIQDVHIITAFFCFLQIFLVHSYVSIQFVILAVISYDRYLAICHPLQYPTRMNTKKVLFLLFFPWFYAFAIVLVVVLLTSLLQLCEHSIVKVYCNNYSVVKLSCSDTSINNIYGLCVTFLTVVGPLVVMISTYVCILKVCFRGSKHTRHKALSTCAPHLASFLNFSFGVFFEVLGSRFSLQNLHSMVALVLSLYFLVVQPLFNPLIYGFKLTKVRELCKNMLHSAISH